jgi:alkylation response protein AidB-like acyl-CoA dehydrogenase
MARWKIDMSAPTTARPAMDPDEEAALLDAIQKWVDKQLRPVAMHHDHNDIWPAELVDQMAEMGLFGATIGTEYGGLGLPSATYAKLVGLISSYWMAPTGIFNSHLIMACAIERFGTEAQKMTWLPKLASGELRGGLALTEPNAGTDLQAIRTTAVRDGDDYVINGTKTWISNAIHGNCFAMLVKTNPKAEPRYKGMSLFIAPKTDGFSVGKKFDKLGYKAIDSAELILENRAFSKPPAGWNWAESMLPHAGSVWPKGRCVWPPNMPNCANPWANPSPNIRLSN